MKALIHKFCKNKIKYDFQKAEQEEMAEPIKNPSRGWCRLFLFCLEEEPDFHTVSQSILKEDALAMVIIDIGAYREQALNEQAINRLKRILNFFREKGLELVLRVVYDHEGKAVEREPFFFSQVKEHLEQLLPLIQKFQDIIFVFQGMLIGNWGEMHTSRFLAPNKMAELWQLLEKSKAQVFFAVRRPSQWRMLHPMECEQIAFPCDTMGLFDDAILGSESHLGTFGTQKKENAGWEGMWRREDELNFEEALCKYVPNGGEAVYSDLYCGKKDIMSVVENFKKMHLTYLNRDYDGKVLNLWQDWKWEENGVWQNVSLFDYIGAHLGYRFIIRDVSLVQSKPKENRAIVSVVIENTGFANLYEEAELYLLQKTEEDAVCEYKFDIGLQEVNSGSKLTALCSIEPINCRLFVGARRKRDGRKIYLGNSADAEGMVLLGRVRNQQLR